ncbi:MerR family transcriptional regulator [Caldithrix abyssi]|nr:MerR family transcriptional regulator [Caldithrix abyssi]
MLIGQLAKKSGFTRDTIRYYEKFGLVRPDSRSESNYRGYGPETLSVLRFIKKTKELGFTLAEIKEMIKAFHIQSYSCDRALTILNAKFEKMSEEITRLKRRKSDINELIDCCHQKIKSSQCLAFEKLWDEKRR